MTLQRVEWKKSQRENFRGWIYNEIEQTLGDRAQLEQHWVNLISQHRARVVGDGTSDVPFIGASDLELPLTSMHFEPVYADLMQTLHIPQDFWSIQPLRSDTVEVAKPLQELISVVERTNLKMRQVNKRALIDMIVLGTTIYKDFILHRANTRRDYNEEGEIVDVRKVEFSPRVEHIPIQDFFIPGYADSINPDDVGGSPWVAHRFELTKGQFKSRAEGNRPFQVDYNPDAVKEVLLHENENEEKLVKERQRIEDRFIPFDDRKIELYEIWARFDIDGDGHDEDVVVVWHQKSRMILRATLNPFLHGERPFHKAEYIPGFGFYGVGLGEADEWAQLSISRLLNNAINNTLLANARMYGVPMGSNISPDEPIFPGKQWPLGPNEQISEVRMGDVYPSIFQMIGNLMQWSEQRTAVSEVRQGNLSELPSRTPASSLMSVLQEGNKKFDMMLANLRGGALDKIGEHVLQNLVQITRDDPRWMAMANQVLGPEKATEVGKVLRGPVHDVKEKFGVNVTATSSQVNKEVEKQSLMSLAQITMQTYPALLQYAQALQDPAVVQGTVQSAYTAQLELLQRLLEAFDIKNPEQFIPAGLTDMKGPGAGGMEQPPGAAGGGQTPPEGPPPSDALSQILGLGG